MASGGRRPGAGRKPGSLNRRPQRGSKLERQMDEYKATVLGVVPFQGDSLALLQGVYRGIYTATHDQIYAASQVLRFEHPPAVTVDGRSVEQIKEEVRQELEGDPEENRRATRELVAFFAKHAAEEAISRMNGRDKYKSGCPAWIGDLVDEVLGEGRADTHASEITPQIPVVVRKRQPVEIDGTADVSGANRGPALRK